MANDQWYTPIEVLDAAVEFFGGPIGLDPTASEAAPAFDYAEQTITEEEDALAAEWPDAPNAFQNPPYSSPAEFLEALEHWHYLQGFRPALALTNASTDTRWAQRLLDAGSYTCFVSPRLRFLRPRMSCLELADKAGLVVGGACDVSEYLFALRRRAPRDRTAREKKFLRLVDAEAALEPVPGYPDLVQPGSPRYSNMIVALDGARGRAHGRGRGYRRFLRAFAKFGHCVKL